MNASCAHPIAMRVRRAEMVRAVIDRSSACGHDVEWVFAGDRDWPQGDALHVTGSADALAAASPGDERHEHYWVDARDDETGWHCVTCGLTEYPGDDAEDEPPREWDAEQVQAVRRALTPAASAAALPGDEGLDVERLRSALREALPDMAEADRDAVERRLRASFDRAYAEYHNGPTGPALIPPFQPCPICGPMGHGRHEDDGHGSCVTCVTYIAHTDSEYESVEWPCAVSRLMSLEAAASPGDEGHGPTIRTGMPIR